MKGCILNFHGGLELAVTCEDESAGEILSAFCHSLELAVSVIPSWIGNKIMIKSPDTHSSDPLFEERIRFNGPGEAVLELEPRNMPKVKLRDGSLRYHSDGSVPVLSPEEWMWRQLSRLSALTGGFLLDRGGFLIHSGLVLFDPGSPGEKKGVLLAGASGSGKSTASSLFRPPWYSLSDDLTMIVTDPDGHYRAHPFPTWSRVLWKEDRVAFRTVNFREAVPLSAVILIDRGPGEKLKPAGKAEALCLLTELAKQANEHLLPGLSRVEAESFNTGFFLNINRLVRKVTAYEYNLKIDKRFWKGIGSLPEFRA